MMNKAVFAIAPSGAITKEKFLEGKLFIETHIGNVYYSESIFNKKRNMAGSDVSRRNAFVSALTDSETGFLWAIRGGFGASRVLPLLPTINVDVSNKLLVGYSDITFYQWYLYKLYGMKSISGPMIQVDFPMDIKSAGWQWLQQLLFEETGSFTFSKEIRFHQFKPIENQLIIGGCLSIISKMCGTPYLPDIQNHVLFLEDLNEDLYKLDGYFSHLKNCGVFKNLHAIILGQFTPPKGVDKQEFEDGLEELFEEYFYSMQIPIILNFPIGHIKNIMALPIGFRVSITETQLSFRK